MEAQKRYMKCDPARLLSVSRAAISLPTDLAPDLRTKFESAVVPPLMVDDNAPPDVLGVPKGALAWT
jgi:hypothetical protein